jgi:hypothetical protein
MVPYLAQKKLNLSQYYFNRILSYLVLSMDSTTAKERESLLLLLVKSCSEEDYNQDKLLRLAEKAKLCVF